MPDPELDPSEIVSRFLLKDEIRSSDNTVRYKAFLPPLSNLKISVFRTCGLVDDQIWALAVEYVEPTRGPVVGRGNLSVAQVIENKLRVAPDAISTSKHANIVEWPADRDHRAAIAKELATLASPAIRRQTSTV